MLGATRGPCLPNARNYFDALGCLQAAEEQQPAQPRLRFRSSNGYQGDIHEIRAVFLTPPFTTL